MARAEDSLNELPLRGDTGSGKRTDDFCVRSSEGGRVREERKGSRGPRQVARGRAPRPSGPAECLAVECGGQWGSSFGSVPRHRAPLPIDDDALAVSDNADIYGTVADLQKRLGQEEQP